MSDKLDKAKEALDNAVTNVAQAAQMVAEANTMTDKFHGEYYVVNKEDMEELKENIKTWKDATQHFLSVVKEEG